MKRLIPLLIASALACGTEVSPDPTLPDISSDDPADPVGQPPLTPPEPEPCTKMDLVFVIDDSGSMAEEQSNLAANFPLFLDVIQNYTNEDGVPLDWRIAVTTTGRDIDYTIKVPDPFNLELPMSENGDNGAFRQGCGMTNSWISRGDANVESTFSCLAEVGTSGPSIEMPLYALELALSDRMGDTNAGFLRPDALLGTIILTDEDDCSRTDNDFEIESDDCNATGSPVTPVDQSVAFLDNVKGARGRWSTSVIAGPNSCESSFGSAVKAERLQEFVSKTGATGTFSSICEGDLASALEEALANFEAACDAFPPVD